MSESPHERDEDRVARTRPRWRRFANALLLITGGAVAGTAVTAAAGGGWHRGGWHGSGHHGHGGERARERAHDRIEHLADALDASDVQRRRMEAVADRFLEAVEPELAGHRAARAELLDALAADTVDRDALEALRSEELRRAEALSAHLVSALGDLAEVLSPEQRAKVRDHLTRHRF